MECSMMCLLGCQVNVCLAMYIIKNKSNFTPHLVAAELPLILIYFPWVLKLHSL